MNYSINDHIKLQTTYDESLGYLNRPKTDINVYQGKVDLELPIGNVTLSGGAAYFTIQDR